MLNERENAIQKEIAEEIFRKLRATGDIGYLCDNEGNLILISGNPQIELVSLMESINELKNNVKQLNKDISGFSTSSKQQMQSKVTELYAAIKNVSAKVTGLKIDDVLKASTDSYVEKNVTQELLIKMCEEKLSPLIAEKLNGVEAEFKEIVNKKFGEKLDKIDSSIDNYYVSLQEDLRTLKEEIKNPKVPEAPKINGAEEVTTVANEEIDNKGTKTEIEEVKSAPVKKKIIIPLRH